MASRRLVRPLVILIHLACAAAVQAGVVVESARSGIEVSGWADASSPIAFSFASSADSPVSRQYSASVMGSRTEFIDIDGQDYLVGGYAQASQSGRLDLPPSSSQDSPVAQFENQAGISAQATLAGGMHIAAQTFFELIFSLAEPHDYDLWADLHPVGRPNETAVFQLFREGVAEPVLDLAGPLAIARGTLAAGTYRLWAESTATLDNTRSSLLDTGSVVQTGFVMILTPEPNAGMLLIATLALLVFSPRRSLRSR